MVNYSNELFLPCRRMSERKLQSRERVDQELPSKVIYNTETTLSDTNEFQNMLMGTRVRCKSQNSNVIAVP